MADCECLGEHDVERIAERVAGELIRRMRITVKSRSTDPEDKVFVVVLSIDGEEIDRDTL